jgi:hypothetical protein
MDEETEACNNDVCLKKDECERYKLFLNGQTYVKRFNGKAHKGCGQFIKIKDK